MTELAEILPATDPPSRPYADRLVLLKQYLPLVRHVAGQYARKLSWLHDYDDLVAMGQLAVWKCTIPYREDGGASFKTYAYITLVHRYELLRRTGRAIKRKGLVYSLDDTNEESGEPRHQHATDEQSQDAIFEQGEGRSLLQGVMGRLTQRQRYVIEQRFVEERTLEDIAGDWGVSRERVRQIEKIAVGKLRRWLMPHYPDARGAPKPVSSRQASTKTERQISRSRQYLATRKVASAARSG